MHSMRTYKIFLAFCSDFPDIDTVKLGIDDANDTGSTARFEWTISSKGICDDDKSQNTILKELEDCDILFRLVYKKYPSEETGTGKEFRAAKSSGIPRYTFVRTDTGESKQTYDKLCIADGDDTGYIYDYTSTDGDNGLRKLVTTSLIAFRDKRALEGGARFPSVLAIIVFIISLLFLLYALTRKMQPEEPTPTEAPKALIDSAQINFNDRIKYAEKLIIEKHYIAAGDSLNALNSICRPEWSKEKATIDSLLRIVPSILPPPPNLPGPGPRPKNTTTIEENTFEIVGAQSPLRGYLSNSIREVLPELSKPSEGRKERWTINIEQDLSVIEVPKLIESDEFMIDIEYGFSIQDNQAKKTILENTLSTRGRSPASLEDAKKHSRQLAAHEIAQQIKQFIQ